MLVLFVISSIPKCTRSAGLRFDAFRNYLDCCLDQSIKARRTLLEQLRDFLSIILTYNTVILFHE